MANDYVSGAIDLLMEAARRNIDLSEHSLLRLEQKIRRAALEQRRVPDVCGWCSGPGPLNEEGLCLLCLYPDGSPTGWKLVPLWPTEAMCKAMQWQIGGTKQQPIKTWGSIESVYGAALAAAPDPDRESGDG